MREIYAKLGIIVTLGFPRLSDAKVKEDIFNGPQIRELFREHQFDEILHGDEKAVWESFKRVCSQFLGKKQSTKLQGACGLVSCCHATENLAVTCL